MTWIEAIIKVLQENVVNKEYEPMDYKDITDIILQRRLKTTSGVTPSRTVNSYLTTYTDLFYRADEGVYGLTKEGKKYQIDSIQNIDPVQNIQEIALEETEEEQELNAQIESDLSHKIIKIYGMYWDRKLIDWNHTTPKLLGRDGATGRPVDFSQMRGIYILYDYREVIYVGQSKDSLAKRLKAHTKDRHNTRWNRFSWFGIDDIDPQDGHFKPTQEEFSVYTSDLINVLEALMIEGLESRGNSKKGNYLGTEMCQYIPDSENN